MWYQVKKKKSFRSWTWMIFRVFLFFFYENSLWKYVSPQKDSLNFIHENKIQKSLKHEKNFSGKQHFCHFHTWMDKKEKKKENFTTILFSHSWNQMFCVFFRRMWNKVKKKQFRDIFFSFPLEKQKISVSQKDKFNQG